MLDILAGIESIVLFMCIIRSSEFSCTLRLEQTVVYFSVKDAVDSLILFQSALLHSGILRFGFLFIWTQRAVSTMMALSWLEIPGMIDTFLTRPGLLLQKKSSTAF